MNQPNEARSPASVLDLENVDRLRRPRPLDPEEAAEYLRLDKRTVTEWARKGYIPAHPLGEGRRKFWRFFEHELETWLSTQTNGTTGKNR